MRRSERHLKKRTHQHEQGQERSKRQQQSYEPRFDNDPIKTCVVYCDGEIYDNTFPLDATVGDVKQGLELKWGVDREQQRGNSRGGLLQISPKYVAWGKAGQLAITNTYDDEVRVWRSGR